MDEAEWAGAEEVLQVDEGCNEVLANNRLLEAIGVCPTFSSGGTSMFPQQPLAAAEAFRTYSLSVRCVTFAFV